LLPVESLCFKGGGGRCGVGHGLAGSSIDANRRQIQDESGHGEQGHDAEEHRDQHGARFPFEFAARSH
jgi:hypothetical protein